MDEKLGNVWDLIEVREAVAYKEIFNNSKVSYRLSVKRDTQNTCTSSLQVYRDNVLLWSKPVALSLAREVDWTVNAFGWTRVDKNGWAWREAYKRDFKYTDSKHLMNLFKGAPEG